MPNRFGTPFQQFFANPVTGAPLAGGKINFYISGSTTPQATYTDSALTIPNANPVILDSNGYPSSGGNPVGIFLQNVAYNVVLTDANNVTIWSADPVYTSDFSTFAQVKSVNGNPNGQLAGTQGSLTTPASMAWDFTNSILYICTQTGSTSTAVWVAINASSATQVSPSPTGRLTAQSGVPLPNTDQVGVANIFYTPYIDNLISIYNGSTFAVLAYSELSLGLNNPAHAANTLYDVFMFSNSGVLTLVTGPAWTSSVAGSSSRGSGAGTTQLTKLNGHLVNAVQITGRNGVNTFTIPANQATYLGTIHIDATAAQVTCHVSVGQNRKWGVWNEFNQVDLLLQVGTGTTWNYAAATVRAANNLPGSFSTNVFNVGSGSNANGINVMMGDINSECLLTITTHFTSTVGSGTAENCSSGFGVNSTTAFTGISGDYRFDNSGGSTANFPVGGMLVTQLIRPAALGLNIYAALESGNTQNNTTFGDIALVAKYRG